MNELKTWADLPKNYSMVLFNKMTEIEQGRVVEEWAENHHCEAMEAREHIDSCVIENCPKCKELKKEFGEDPYCECEVYQWFLIDLSEFDAEYLNKEFKLDIFYSDILDNYVLPVYHFGTPWRGLLLKGGYATDF